MTKGLLLSAPASGSGKTVLTLGLLSAMRSRGIQVTGAKAGPDYIDSAYHLAATKQPSFNLDPWAMGDGRLRTLASQTAGDHVLIEGAMGLYDGAADGSASPASLAKNLSTPVLLVVDGAKQSHSIAALVRGFRDHDPSLTLAGVILNRVGSPRHGVMLQQALKSIDVAVFGAVPRSEHLKLPERHLGLVQAGEHGELASFIEAATRLVAQHCDMQAIIDCFMPMAKADRGWQRLKPLGQHMAIAQDEAFTFIYPHWLSDWRDQGAELSFFSPLLNEAPPSQCDAVFLPGGYPELHGAKLAEANRFKEGMQTAVKNGALVYGECGGYMVLGKGIVDRQGNRYAMCGLLNLETSFARPKLHLGYRKMENDSLPFGPVLRGHEFHYTSAVSEKGDPLFHFVCDALGKTKGSQGLRLGNVMGSYMHVIDGARR